MSIESYRHRRDENWEYKLPSGWYLDPVEVDHVYEMIAGDEISKERVDALIFELSHKLANLSLQSGGNLAASETTLYDQINNTMNKLRELNQDRVPGQLNLTKEDDFAH